jgi:uncharacterized hydrophobic protein (TIGR00271 family)
VPLRESVALRFGVTPDGRLAVVRAMYERHGKERAGYWLELVIAMGIATYGLVLGSTGVVIGAMLVSPLMSPLVEIGMGLVTGSAVLMLQAVLRTTFSIAVVVSASAVLTYLLPYHEMTSEISSRTAPTLLDLYVAGFCAIAAAYTTARQSSDTVAAAAGTAISIALVPPLCVVGWGIGAGELHVSRGAALLFTANFCAILLFAVVVFLLFRFDTVVADDLGGKESLTDRLAARFHRFLGAKYGPVLRLGMPVVLVAAVFVPLRRALNEVAWKTRVRTEVDHVLSETPAAHHAVQSSIAVANGAIAIRLLIVGGPSDSSRLEANLKQEVRRATGISPAVDVVAVPDAASVRTIAEGAIATMPAKPRLDTADLRSTVDTALRAAWPSSAGPLRAWRIVVDGDGVQTIVVVHFGEALGAIGEQLLHGALHEQIDGTFGVRDLALSTKPSDADAAAGPAWLPTLRRSVDAVLDANVGVLCVTFPTPEAAPKARETGRGADVVSEISKQARAELSRLPDGDSTVALGRGWHVQLEPDSCPERPSVGLGDGGDVDVVTDGGGAAN